MITTLLLIIGGTVAFLALEYNNPNTIGEMSVPHKIMASYFQSVTPRTAGFNTVDIGKLFPATLLITMFLMFVGASPGGTGGGIKTTTFALVLMTIRATLRNSRNTIIFNRRIPVETVRRALTLTILALMVVAVGIFCLDAVEKRGLMEAAFEVISAFGTVGLSMGITPYLSSIGKIIIIAMMFIGRVGPLTLLLALSMEQREPRLEPPKEGISIG
jgi:trk system potassium uptake protein TrkH